MSAAKKKNSGLVDVWQLAKLLNVTDRTVQALAKKGILPKAAHGKYDLIPCLQAYIIYLRTGGEAAGVEVDALKKERAHLYKVQREKAELELLVARAEMLPAEETERLLLDLATRCRTKLLAIPSRAAQQCSNRSAVEVKAILEAMIFEALEELADDAGELHSAESLGSLAPAGAPENFSMGKSKPAAKPGKQRRNR